jgi:hypothetical protein
MRVRRGGTVAKPVWGYGCSIHLDNREACPGVTMRVDSLDQLVREAIEGEVLSTEGVAELVAEAKEKLKSVRGDELQVERRRVEATLADLDRRIRATAGMLRDGLIDEADAREVNGPLVAQREAARLRLAGLPQVVEVPELVVEPEKLRAALAEAWQERPLEDRRRALAKLVDRIELSPQGIQVVYSLAGYTGHAQEGPPSVVMSHQTCCFATAPLATQYKPEVMEPVWVLTSLHDVPGLSSDPRAAPNACQPAAVQPRKPWAV